MIGENVIPLIDPDEIIKSKVAIKVNIPLIGLDEIGKKISLAVIKRTKKNKKRTVEYTAVHHNSSQLKLITNRKTDDHHERWLIFRTTLAPNIRLKEQFIYDETGILSVSSSFIGDKRRVTLLVIDID